MKVELLTRPEDLAGVTGRWDELAQNDRRDGFFRTWGWYQSWIRHIRPDARPFVPVVRDTGGKIAGLAPLCQVSYRDLGFRLNGISWGGREVVSGDFLDFISESETRPQVASAILDFLWATRSRWSLLIMGEVIDGGDSYRALENLEKRNGLPLRRQEERICPYIALPGSFEEYLNGLSSSTRYNIRRRMRNSEKNGCRLAVYSQPQEISRRLDTLIQLHLARWRKENLPGTLGRPGFAPFLREICSRPPAGSSCRLYLLNHEDAPVAALLMFYFGHSALYYQAGWDPDSPLAQHSPAVVIMAHSIRDAIENGMQYYEFLRGDEAYKSHWTKTYRKTATLLCARSFMAKEYLRAARLKDRVKHLVFARGNRANAQPMETRLAPEASE